MAAARVAMLGVAMLGGSTSSAAGLSARLLRVAALSAGLLGAGCGPAAPGANAPGANVVAKNIVTTGGTPLAAACTPSGPEMCFNASDDNCNGVIDEGCGVGTGVLQFMVAWSEAAADIDIVVMDPSGARVHESARSIASGLQLEKSCPEDGCHGQNIENVFFEGNEPPRGRYVVEVKLVDPHGADLPVRARLSARVGNRTYAMNLELSPGSSTEKQGFAFDL